MPEREEVTQEDPNQGHTAGPDIVWDRPRNVLQVMDTMVEASSDAVVVMDLDGRVLRWNPAAAELYGWTAEEVRGRELPHVPAELRVQAISEIRAVAASEQPATRTRRAVRRSGASVSIRAVSAPLVDGDGSVVGVISLHREISRESRSGWSHQEAATTLAEELRGPLTSLFGYTQLLRRDEIAEDPVRRARTLEAMEERASTVTALIDDLVLSARIAEGSAPLEPEALDLTGVIADALARVRKRTAGTRVVVDYQPGLGMVRLDRRLVEGAVAYLVEGGVRHCGPEVKVTAMRDSDAVIIRVIATTTSSDSSAGPDAPLTCAQQAVRDATMQFATGLVTAHGGELSCSDSANGCAYEICLPLQLP